MSESFERAMGVRRAVLGDEYMDRVLAKTSPLNAPFQEFVTRYVWGESWLDGTLDPEVLSLITIALVATLGQVGEVRLHTAGALRNGCTPEQIGAVLKHVAVYAGVAKAVAALNVADEEIVAKTTAEGTR
jgi:alkylhydroperoxidase/carboxymuconolactone decarboxylase family protein YurZ